MSEKKKTETKTAKATKTQKPVEPAAGAKPPKAKREKAPKEDLVVFAIRLTEAERNAIHEAAGPRNATQFVRAVALAAAKDDDTAFKNAISEAKKLRA